MIGDLEELERDIACGKTHECSGTSGFIDIYGLGLEVIAKGLQERYVEFQPLMKVAEEDIILRLEDLSNKVNENLQIADSFLRENSSMDSSVEVLSWHINAWLSVLLQGPGFSIQTSAFY